MDLIAYYRLVFAPYARARFGRDERGASLVEYALLVALIAVVCIVAIRILGNNANANLTDVGNEIAPTTAAP